jgi:hypothetical protein
MFRIYRLVHFVPCRGRILESSPWRTLVLYRSEIRISPSDIFFPLVLQPNSGLGRLHEIFRFTSVTRSRRVGWTPWTGDQLVERPRPVHKHRKIHTHTSQTLNIHAQSGIRNDGPGVRASEDSSCLRLLGYRDRPSSDIRL